MLNTVNMIALYRLQVNYSDVANEEVNSVFTQTLLYAKQNNM